MFTVAVKTGCFLNCIFLFKIWKRVAVCEDNFRPSVHRWLQATGRKQRLIYANIRGGSSLSLSQPRQRILHNLLSAVSARIKYFYQMKTRTD